MKRFISVLLIMMSLVTMFPVVQAASINDSSTFIKQGGSDWCTYTSATNMIRRRALLDGKSNWSTYTDSSLRSVARASGGGIKNSFTYAGYGVTASSWSGKSTSQKKSDLISLLASHPEGIVIYTFGGKNTHAVLLCSYTNGTFYVADPSNYKPKGLIKLTDAQFNGGNQDERISWIKKIWYVSSKSSSSQNTVKNTSIASNLSINMTSYPVSINYKNSYGLRGNVSSNYKITSVKGYIYNSKGSCVMYTSDYPYSGYMDVRYANLNKNLLFNKLSRGNYTLKVVAKDASNRQISWSKSFTVR